MRRCSGTKVTDAMSKATFYRMAWWPKESQIVQAAHTVIACCSMTLEQRRIICVGIKEPQQYQGVEFLPRNLVASGKFHHGRGRTSMHPSVLLMVCLLSLYVAAMGMFWHGLSGHKPEARLETEVRLALKAGQTIVGVADTAHGLAFAIGDDVRDEKYYDV